LQYGNRKIIIPDMRKTIGYMITWTTYGTWLQGDKRGYVKDGTILPKGENLKSANQNQQKFQTVRLNIIQKQIAENAILAESQRVNQKILALAVCSNHVHLVAQANSEPMDLFVRRYKVAATTALRKYYPDKIWTRGFDKRFCFSQEDLTKKIRYVEQHNNI
jgi:REP element-mobilizing transposase RayT